MAATLSRKFGRENLMPNGSKWPATVLLVLMGFVPCSADDDPIIYDKIQKDMTEILSGVLPKSLVYQKLTECAAHGALSCVAALLQQGADVNARDKNGRTALIHACEGGYIQIVRLLLEKQAAADLRDKDGNTALMRACCKGYPDVVKLLLEKGAHVDSGENVDWTPVMYAAAHGGVEIVRELLAKGANAGHKARDGRYAAYWANTLGYAEIVEMLKKAQGKGLQLK